MRLCAKDSIGAGNFASCTKSRAIPVSFANKGRAKVTGNSRLKTRCGKIFSVTRLLPLEALIQFKAASRFTPCAFNVVKPSATDHKFTASNMLLMAFTAKPAPDSPTC